MRTVPYEKFAKLQLLLGESFASIMEVARAAAAPCLSLDDLAALRGALIDSLPAEAAKEAMASGFSQSFVFDRFGELEAAGWPDLDTVRAFVAQQSEFHAALRYFGDPELRIRVDCLLLSGLCTPETVSEALRGWSKYAFSPDAVGTYSFYFCNMDVMRDFTGWKQYIARVPNKDYRWLLSQAYDVQTKGDLVVLMNDLSIRSAISMDPGDTVRELMMTAFIQTKKEERKVNEGVPAKSTAIFEWSSMYCSLFDRVQKTLDAVGKEDAVESVKTKLRTIRTNNIRKLSDYELAFEPEAK